MNKIRLTFCLFIGLIISPFAVAHETPLLHDHGVAGAALLFGALFAVSVLVTTVCWAVLKRGDP